MNSLHTLSIAVLLTASTAFAADSGVSTAPVIHPSIQVDYADTLQGVQAMFAVRACATEDVPQVYGSGHGVIPNTPPVLSLIQERKSSIDNDIVVRVMDDGGDEISRHEGAHNVCGYARMAAAFLVRSRGASGSWSDK